MAEEYDFKEELVPRPNGRRAIPAPVQIGSPVLNYRSATTTTATPLQPDRFKNIQLPIYLLAGGIGIEFVSSLWSRDAGIANVLVELFLVTPLMLFGIAIAANFRGLSLKPWPVSLLKLAAIAVAPTAAVRLIEPILSLLSIVGLLIGFAVTFVLYFSLLGALFDLEESDTWYVVWVMFLVRVGFYFIAKAIF